MKLNQWIQFILISSSIITLAACSHKTPPNPSAVYEANSAYHGNGKPEASGLGNESGFGDQGGGGERVLSKRVYYFDFDSNVVHEVDKPAIMANANYLSSRSKAQVMLEGHTDPRGSREYNIGLGERRAKAVAAILTAKGINPAQVRIVSYGAEKLASTGHNEDDYQQDRRVVLAFLKR
jgi:peptidoglycan-associated lipoprotein